MINRARGYSGKNIKALFTDKPYLISSILAWLRIKSKNIWKENRKIVFNFEAIEEQTTVKCLASCILILIEFTRRIEMLNIRHSFVFVKIR